MSITPHYTHTPEQFASPVLSTTLVATERAKTLVEWADEARAANGLATALVRTPFAGSWKGDVDGATAAILKGAEVGLTPVTALGAFDNIQGTPAPKAITLRALVQSHGHDLEIVEETDQRAVARYRRNGDGEWQTTEFTIDEARQMNLLSKDNWKKQPRNMLVARVTSKAARLVAADVILGIGYSAEEVRDQAPMPSAPNSAADRMRAALRPEVHVQQIETPAEAVPAAEDAVEGAGASSQSGAPATPESVTSPQLKAIGAAMSALGITQRDNALLYVADVIGREVKSRNELTKDEASRLLDALANDSLPKPEAQ